MKAAGTMGRLALVVRCETRSSTSAKERFNRPRFPVGLIRVVMLVVVDVGGGGDDDDDEDDRDDDI